MPEAASSGRKTVQGIFQWNEGEAACTYRLSHKAQLPILDEPTAGLDVEARNEILDLLREYAAEDESRTILITSHIASDLEHLAMTFI